MRRPPEFLWKGRMLVPLIVVVCVAAFVLGATAAILLRGARDRSAAQTLVHGESQQLDARRRAETRGHELAERVAELEQELESQRTVIHRLQREIAAMEGVVEGAEAQVDEYKARFKQSDGAMDGKQESVNEATAGLRKVLEHDRAKTEKLHRMLAAAESAQALNKQAAKQAEAKSIAAERKLTEQVGAVARLNEQLAEAREAVEAARQWETATESSRAEIRKSSGAGAMTLMDALDADPNLHSGGRETMRMLYARLTKPKK